MHGQVNQEIDGNQRSQLMKNWLGSTDEWLYVETPVMLEEGSHVHVGEDFFANFGWTVLDTCPVQSFRFLLVLAPIVWQTVEGWK
ncbi:hypothetical protein [Streptococcus cuniculi]|uniref:Uncharacterized protein n=1 Tax=Streptococcus cuniculi TaxID=1432788 RepID=A0A4Y9JA95_9STRE|nr:hypothetical protein [Streptococcus cuniculi]MBF0779173.1 hypothetical protein [Streptococcus cuniculi]TFU96834.1 hypothetical protein E4T82_10690 [Streptococcus cuniculi]